MVKRLIVFILYVFLFTPFLGCQEEECTSRQHFEIMQIIKSPGFQDYSLHKISPVTRFIYRLDHVLRIGVSKWIHRKHMIKSVKPFCKVHGVSFRAFDRAHEKYGLLKLTYTEEIKTYLKEMWKSPPGRWIYLDKIGRTITREDLEYDLGLAWRGDLIIVIDKDGKISIDGLTMERAELNTHLEKYYTPRIGSAVWHLKTAPQVKTKYVFDLMDDIFNSMLKNSYLEDDFPISGKFTFSESTDITSGRLKRLVSSEFFNPDIYTLLPEIHFLIHLAESDEIFLNGEHQSSIEELVQNLSKRYDSEKGSSICIVVDDEVPWSKALEVGRRLRDENLWIRGGFRRSRDLDELEAVRRGT